MKLATSPPRSRTGFVRHRGPITCAVGVPNTRSLLTSGYDGAVGLFDLDTEEAELLGYHDHLVNRITVNQAGTHAASSSSDYTIYLWDLRRRSVERVLRGHADDVEDFVFIDDARGASVSRDWRVLLWDLEQGSILRVLAGHEKDVLSIDYHSGKLFTSGDDMTLRVWDVKTGRLEKVWGPFDSETDTCALDPLHGRVVLGCDDGFVRVFDLASGEVVCQQHAHTSGIKKVAVSRQTGDILSAAYDQRVLIWDAETLRHKVTLSPRPALWERSFNWSPDGASIFAGTFDGTVLVWDAATGECLAELGSQAEPEGNACLNEVAVLPGGDIGVVSDDGFVRLARLNATEAVWLSKTRPESGRILMNAVAANEQTGAVLTGAHNHTVHIYERDGDTLRDEVEVQLGEGPINSIRVADHPGFESVAFVACYSGAIVRVTPKGEIHGKFRVHENAVKALRLHPHKRLGVSCSADGILVSWDLEGHLRTRFLGPMAIVDDVDISPSGHAIASVGRDFALRIHGLDDGHLLHTISLGRRSPKGVCFYDDDTVIVTNYWGELIKATLSTGCVLRRQIARNGISSANRMGDNVVATSYDGGVYLVRPEDLAVQRTLRAMTQRVDGKGWE